MLRAKLLILVSIFFISALQVKAEDYSDDFDWSDGIFTGDDLKIILGNINDKVIVTLWMNNIHLSPNNVDQQWEQNKKNQRVKGTIKSLIERCHPHTVYAEADVSDYNINAYTFEERGKDWGIPLDTLNEGPLVMPMYQNHGEMFWGSNQTQTVSLARAVHRYLIQVESENFNQGALECDVELIFNEVNEYVIYNPYNPYEHYVPTKMDKHHEQRLEREGKKKKKGFTLAEPEKAFT
mmetsp:Transcript_10252/g.9054  ORF Transcript_10252/g.9054 Transcript_10252/m.9054 type:complete len:237 (-) Transcript_10252:39-749(-)